MLGRHVEEFCATRLPKLVDLGIVETVPGIEARLRARNPPCS